MKFIKTYEKFKFKNITLDDIIKCIESDGLIWATKIKDFPENNPENPLKPISVDDDGLILADYEGNQYEIELANVDKIDY